MTSCTVCTASISRIVVSFFVIVAASPFATAADNTPTDAAAPSDPVESPESQPKDRVIDPGSGAWYLLHGSSNNHPRLHDADSRIDKELNQLLRSIAPKFDDVRTFSDQADDFMIWTPFVGVGKTCHERWDAFFQIGYSAGKVVTRADDPTLLFAPLHSDVEIHRSSLFAGLGLSYFPLGLPELRTYTGMKERLSSAKPFVATTLSWNHLTADSTVRVGPAGLGTFSVMEKSDDWNTWSGALLAGAEVPVGKRYSFNVNAGYNWFFDYGDDFSGPSFAIFWKRYFGGGHAKR